MGYPVPVFEKYQLHSEHGRSLDHHVRIAPRAHPGLVTQAKIFDAGIVPTDERVTSVNHDDLAMIAKIHSKRVSTATTATAESRGFNPGPL
jgi:hypothetical protein